MFLCVTASTVCVCNSTKLVKTFLVAILYQWRQFNPLTLALALIELFALNYCNSSTVCSLGKIPTDSDAEEKLCPDIKHFTVVVCLHK